LRPRPRLPRRPPAPYRDRGVRDTDWRGIALPASVRTKRPRRARQDEREVILTVALNAAIDRTVAVPTFRLGRRHRAVESRTVAGGKGINVARALNLLGRPVIATGFVGG